MSKLTLKDRINGFRKPVTIVNNYHKDDERAGSRVSKYGKISYNAQFNYENSIERREIARAVHKESLTAGGITRRLVDNVINIGLSWESTPLWDMIKDAPEDKEKRREWTVQLENLMKLYSESTEADIHGVSTFKQIQRTIEELGIVEGEAFILLRYLNGAGRISPVTTQLLNNDQISTPYNSQLTKNVKGKIVDGIEYDVSQKAVAIWVESSYSKNDHKRIQFVGNSGRRFVIHYKATSKPGQSRGIPEMASLSYELSRLTEVEINEIEKMASASMWLGAIETDKDANPKRIPFETMDSSGSVKQTAVDSGIKQVDVGDKAMILNTLDPGQKFNLYKSDYTNTNLEALIEVYETRICAKMGVSLAFYKNKHDSNYTAARAGIIFTFNNILVRRDDIITGLLDPFKEAIISEWIKADVIKAPGYFTSVIARKSWLYGVWNGINRVTVDPVKESKSSQMRRLLGDTTGEREAKAHNGSDFRENLEKLRDENILLAEVNKPLDPKQFIEENKTESKTLSVTGEDSNIDFDSEDETDNDD